LISEDGRHLSLNAEMINKWARAIVMSIIMFIFM
jgi:hypothetical protein